MRPHPSTPAQQAASRRNALRSTGPRTAAGLQRSSLNNLRHGLYSERLAETMPAFGEDPQKFERLYEDLLREWRPRAATGRRLVHQLAVLYWKFDRLARAEHGMAASRLEKYQGARERLELATREVDWGRTMAEVKEKGLSGLPDSPAKFRKMLAALGKIRAALRRRDARAHYTGMLVQIYGSRPARCHPAAPDPKAEPGANTPDELAPAGFRELDDNSAASAEEDRSQFERQIAALTERAELDFALYRRRHAGISAAKRDAQLVPQGLKGVLLIRRENSLLWQIDRTVRLLLLLEGSRHGRPSRSRRSRRARRLRARGDASAELAPDRAGRGTISPARLGKPE